MAKVGENQLYSLRMTKISSGSVKRKGKSFSTNFWGQEVGYLGITRHHIFNCELKSNIMIMLVFLDREFFLVFLLKPCFWNPIEISPVSFFNICEKSLRGYKDLKNVIDSIQDHQ